MKLNKLMTTYSDTFKLNKLNFRELVFVDEDYASGRYDLAKG